ncbi:MAG TPA: YbhB/YbcL family Raf kinase inhibitor-like protein, partial [Aquihabitans sp.]|nr:YbhB/YbcL family Raf kinase inhibitor-like protein [Aquihabitans sp.]
MELTSTAFDPDGTIPERHTRPGGNVSPPLAWTGVPATTNDLVLTCTDPDAPGGTFVHWLLGGIRPDRDGLDEGEHP